MYAEIDFPDFEDGAARVLGFDIGLSLALVEGETPISISSALVCIDGTDSALALDPDARFIGKPTIVGTYVNQAVALNDAPGLLAGNTYALTLYVTTSFGQVLAPWSRFQVSQGYGYPITPSSTPTSNLTSFVLATAFQKTVLSSSGDYAGQDFPTADQGERWLYGFDLSPALSTGETIASVTFALTLEAGTDIAVADDPAVRFAGAPSISGAVVKRLTVWPKPLPDLAGNVYILNATARTSFNQSISTWARVAISSWL